MLLRNAADPAAMTKLVEAFCAADRPESIHTWKRPPQVQDLLRRIAVGDIPLTHDGLDSLGNTHRVAHIRAILEQHGLLPSRDPYLARFEAWIDDKLDTLSDPAVRRPVERFAQWHHLRRVRGISAAGKPTRGPVHASKQDITETVKFLTWLQVTHGRTAETCVQADVDEWLANGPSTRHLIRTFMVWAKANKVNRTVAIGHRQPQTVRTFTQDQRLHWLKELLTGTSESVPYRLAGVLLLLYAQPLVKVATLRTTDIVVTKDEMQLSLGKEPVPVSAPFAHLITEHLQRRPNLRTTADADTDWLFPGYRAGTHLHPHTLMMRIRALGVDLLGARNAALRGLVTEVPPPLVAEMLGYSYAVTQRHAALAADPYARYAIARSPNAPTGRSG